MAAANQPSTPSIDHLVEFWSLVSQFVNLKFPTKFQWLMSMRVKEVSILVEFHLENS